METGDKVWYTHVPRGGYGFESKAPAIFIKRTAVLATVDVELQVGGWKRIHVHPNKLERRG